MLSVMTRRVGALGALAESSDSHAIFVAMSEFEPYIASWRKRWREQELADEQAALRARRTAEQLAELLRDRYGARRVILIGSLARGEFGLGSDIDFLAEGIADDDFFRAGAEMEAASDGLKVDLVPFESATPDFLSHALDGGVVLHDASR